MKPGQSIDRFEIVRLLGQGGMGAVYEARDPDLAPAVALKLIHEPDGNRDAAAMGHGKDYVYPHDQEGHFTPQQYLPKRLLGTYFYAPSQEGYESQVTARLEMWRDAQRKALGITKVENVPSMSEEQIQDMKRKIK